MVVARLRAHPDTIEIGRLAQYLVAALVEVVVPLGILDDQPDLGIDPLRRGQDPVLGQPHHQLAAVVLPGVAGHGICPGADGHRLGLPGCLAFRAGAIGEPEIVDHDLVEQAGGVLEDGLELLLRGLVGVAGDAVPARGRFADLGGSDTSGDLEAGLLKTGPCPLQRGTLRPVTVAKDLHIDLGHCGPAAPIDGLVESLLTRKPIPDVLGGEQGRELVNGPVASGQVAQVGRGRKQVVVFGGGQSGWPEEEPGQSENPR